MLIVIEFVLIPQFFLLLSPMLLPLLSSLLFHLLLGLPLVKALMPLLNIPGFLLMIILFLVIMVVLLLLGSLLAQLVLFVMDRSFQMARLVVLHGFFFLLLMKLIRYLDSIGFLARHLISLLFAVNFLVLMECLPLLRSLSSFMISPVV